MRIESYIFGFIAVFFGVTSVVYWFTSHDPAGTAMLILAGGLGVIIGSFAYLAARRMPPRPEDLNDAEISDGAGEIGFFSPHSWWPLPTGLFGTFMGVGIVYGWWIFLIAGIGLMISLTGFIYEYYVQDLYH